MNAFESYMDIITHTTLIPVQEVVLNPQLADQLQKDVTDADRSY